MRVAHGTVKRSAEQGCPILEMQLPFWRDQTYQPRLWRCHIPVPTLAYVDQTDPKRRRDSRPPSHRQGNSYDYIPRAHDAGPGRDRIGKFFDMEKVAG